MTVLNIYKEIAVSLISFIGFTLHAITGFGGNILVFPVLSFLFGTVIARTSLNLIAWTSSISVAADCYKDINFRELRTIMIWMGMGLIAGTLMIPYIKSDTVLMFVYGIVIVLVALFKLFSKKETNFPKPVLFIILILAGIIQALFVSGGAFLVIYCAQVLKEKKSFRATFTMVWLSIYTVMFFVQLFKGAYSKEVIIISIFGAVPVLLASWIGSRITSKINQKAFMILVYIFILFVGVSLVGTNLRALLV
ncbi:MAG: sulfite exporter TauE/SafE family protein [Lachnospiraceae bacterium]|nr:sulfite exporter TauE/SafE family protein [Lachnospiraceae bacterium]MBP5565136.1 sulfite exporter TauE/SafE family protein [Lachnospiraceae bacterium]